MKALKFIIAVIITLSLPFNIKAATVSGTYNVGAIATNLSSYSSTCNGPATTLSVALPSGGPWLVTGIDVSYTMTAVSGAYKSEQRSKVYCQNTAIGESSFLSGVGATGGTYAYNRTALTIANGSYAGGTALVFEMQAYRTWGGSGCNTTYNYVDNGSWTITVAYMAAPTCPQPSGLTAAIIAGNLVDVSWTENGSATVWDIELGLQGFTPTGTPTHNDVTNSYTFSGLIPDTDYEYYVRSDCGGGDTSEWVGPYVFTTPILTGMVYIGATSYGTLKAAFDAINSGTYTGDITITIGNADGQTITETAEAVLNKSGTGSASYSSVTIRPGSTNIKLKGAINGACCVPSGVVKLNQAENVTVDGRVGGTGTNIDLIIENTQTGSYSAGFVFLAASNNVLTYTHVKSAATGTCCGVGTISIADNNVSGGKGSSNNTVSYNMVSGSEGNLPRRAIAGKGATTRENNNNLIKGNTIFNFSEFGIYLGNGSSDGYNRNWVIEENIIYQPTEFTALGNDMAGIAIGQVFSTTGTELGTHTIANNIIGGNGASGDWKVASTSTRRVAGIAINTITTAYTKIYGNTISNFDVKTTSTATDYGMFSGIVVSQGKVDINGNTIGSLSNPTSIKVARNNTSAGGFVSGIQVRSSSDYENIINDNIVSGISMTIGTGYFSNFYGIRNLSSTTYPADSVANNNVSYIQLSTVYNAIGIYAQGLISSNQVRDIDFVGASTTAELVGIRWLGGDITGTGSRGVENNEVILGLNQSGSSIGGNDVIKGIVIGRGDAEVYYNSVLIRGTGTNTDDSYGIEIPSSGLTQFKNNLIYNERSGGGGQHYGVYSPHVNKALINLANNAYVVGTTSDNYIGYWGANISSLSAWMSASGEVNAISDVSNNQPVTTLFPLYATQNTLDVSLPSFLVAGVNVTGITTDIASFNRDASTPTIGAHEATSSGVGLPIELVSFTAECNDAGVVLKWTTALEINNHYFTIERSGNGTDYSAIGEVQGAGNSVKVLHYSLIDDAAPTKSETSSYYRLKQTDYDGGYKYSKIVSVNCSEGSYGDNDLKVYPNPFASNFTVSFKPSDATQKITIYNVFGQIVYSAEVNPQTTSMDVLVGDVLPAGNYFLSVESDGLNKLFNLVKYD